MKEFNILFNIKYINIIHHILLLSFIFPIKYILDKILKFILSFIYALGRVPTVFS